MVKIRYTRNLRCACRASPCSPTYSLLATGASGPPLFRSQVTVTITRRHTVYQRNARRRCELPQLSLPPSSPPSQTSSRLWATRATSNKSVKGEQVAQAGYFHFTLQTLFRATANKLQPHILTQLSGPSHRLRPPKHLLPAIERPPSVVQLCFSARRTGCWLSCLPLSHDPRWPKSPRRTPRLRFLPSGTTPRALSRPIISRL